MNIKIEPAPYKDVIAFLYISKRNYANAFEWIKSRIKMFKISKLLLTKRGVCEIWVEMSPLTWVPISLDHCILCTFVFRKISVSKVSGFSIFLQLLDFAFPLLL